MVVQYPHIVRCTQTTEGEVVGGVPQPGTTVELEYKCRYRPNTSAKSVKGQDGLSVIYRGTCYIHKPDTLLRTGDVISVDGQVESAVVLQVYNAQFRSRIILM